MLETGGDFVFDINILKRIDRSDGINVWDSTNAKELLDYTTKKGYKVGVQRALLFQIIH
jgi:hypothetical protein